MTISYLELQENYSNLQKENAHLKVIISSLEEIIDFQLRNCLEQDNITIELIEDMLAIIRE